MNVARIIEPLRAEDKVTVAISPNPRSWRLPYMVTIECNRQVWPNPLVRGGLSASYWVGTCRSRDTAERRAARALGKLQRARTRRGSP